MATIVTQLKERGGLKTKLKILPNNKWYFNWHINLYMIQHTGPSYQFNGDHPKTIFYIYKLWSNVFVQEMVTRITESGERVLNTTCKILQNSIYHHRMKRWGLVLNKWHLRQSGTSDFLGSKVLSLAGFKIVQLQDIAIRGFNL